MIDCKFTDRLIAEYIYTYMVHFLYSVSVELDADLTLPAVRNTYKETKFLPTKVTDQI